MPTIFFLNQLVAITGIKPRESNGFCSSPTFKWSHTETVTAQLICQYENLSPEEISRSTY